MRRVWKNVKRISMATFALTLSSSLAFAGDGVTNRSLSSNFSFPDPTVMSGDMRFGENRARVADQGMVQAVEPGVNRYQTGRPVSTTATNAAPMEYHAGDHYSSHAVPSGDLPADCCMGCDRSFYGRAEAIWIERSGDSNFSLAQQNTLGRFGFDVNGRYTIGQMFDCTDGVEFTFTGPLAWTRSGPTLVGANLGSNLGVAGPFNNSDLDAFNQATLQQQFHRARYLSYEFSRRWWAWDALSTLAGVRAIQYDESFVFNTESPVGNGLYTSRVKNYLAGFQLGADFFYPYTHRLSYGSKVRAGVYGNMNRSRTFISKGNRILANNALTEEFDVSGLFEFGSYFRYSIRSNITAIAGYESWYIVGLATASEQRLTTVSPAAGTKVYATDEVFFHGATAGLEVSF